MGHHQDAAAAELLREVLQGTQAAGRRRLFTLGAFETARDAHGIQFRTGLQAFGLAVAALDQPREAAGHAQPEPRGDDISGFRGAAQRRGHHGVPLVSGQGCDGVTGLAAADFVQRNVGGSLQPALRVPVGLAVADEGKRREGHAFHCAKPAVQARRV